MLPGESSGYRAGLLDAKYAADAISELERQMFLRCLKPAQVAVKVFGGARSVSGEIPDTLLPMLDVGAKNHGCVMTMLTERGFHVAAGDIGGTKARHVIFDLASGHVWVRRLPKLASIITATAA